jgi:hypothetical protein
MTQEQVEKLELPKHLSEIVGSRSEILTIKTALIKKFGYDAWEQLVVRSSQSKKQ